jgi:hypothetical protein
MNATKLLLLLALSAGTAIALSAPARAADSSDHAWMRNDVQHAGADFVVQNEAEKHRLEAQGFPQYTY